MSIWAALAGGFIGTLVLTTILRVSTEVRLTRIDLPFLLGTAFTKDRLWAKVVGYVLHFVAGFGFALVYFAVFVAIDRSGWLLGAVFGLLHGLFVSTALVNVLLPAIHPRMAWSLTAPGGPALLEPPGFLLLNYGPRTPLVTVLAHVVYGSIVGGFVSFVH
jgi:hypothetical protein